MHFLLHRPSYQEHLSFLIHSRACIFTTHADSVRVTKVVARVSFVPSIVGSYDGPVDICTASDVDTASAFHGRLFRVHRSHFVFQSRRKAYSVRAHDLSADHHV